MEAPPWAARGFAAILLLLFATTVVMAAVLNVSDSVSSAFVLMPVRGTDPIKAPRQGSVAEVRVAEGQTVGKGEALFVIQSAAIGDRFAELQTLEAQLHGIAESLTNAHRKYQSQQRATQEEGHRLHDRLAYLQRAITLKQHELALAQDTVETYKRLYERGLTSRLEYANRLLGANKVTGEMDQTMTERDENRNALAKLQYDTEASQAEYTELTRRLKEDRERTRIRIAALRKELAQSQGNELTVPAACTGTVLRLQVQASGAIVQEGESMAELACAEERLQAELTVPPSGVGRITPGLGVKLLYDAFPYQRYGLRYGTVRWVSPSSVLVKDTRVFRVLVDIAEEALLIQGQPRPLMAGMSGKAEVVVGRTSVLSYAFAPLRQLKESFADIPARVVSGDI
jgi:membrane fusion protein